MILFFCSLKPQKKCLLTDLSIVLLQLLAALGLLKRFKAILMAYPKAQFCGQLPPEGRDAFIFNQQNAGKKVYQRL